MVRRQAEETGQGLIVKSNGPKSAELVIGASGAAITWRMWVAGSAGSRQEGRGCAANRRARTPEMDSGRDERVSRPERSRRSIFVLLSSPLRDARRTSYIMMSFAQGAALSRAPPCRS